MGGALIGTPMVMPLGKGDVGMPIGMPIEEGVDAYRGAQRKGEGCPGGAYRKREACVQGCL